MCGTLVACWARPAGRGVEGLLGHFFCSQKLIPGRAGLISGCKIKPEPGPKIASGRAGSLCRAAMPRYNPERPKATVRVDHVE